MKCLYWKGNLAKVFCRSAYLCFCLLSVPVLTLAWPTETAGSVAAKDILPAGMSADTNIEVLLYPVGVDFPDSERCGYFNVLLEVAVRNTGATALGALQVEANLSAVEYFGAAFQGVVERPRLTAASRADILPLPASDYNGGSLPFLLEGGGRLLPGETIYLRFAIEVFPEAADAPAQAMAGAKAHALVLDAQGMPVPDPGAAGQSLSVEDWSDAGLDFDGTEYDPDNATSLGDCWRQARNLSARGAVNITLDTTCQALVTPATILTNFLQACGEAALPEGGYYRLYYDHEEVTGPIDAASLVGRSLVFQVKSVVNPCSPIYGSVRFSDNSPPLLSCPPTQYFTCADVDRILNNPATLDPSDPAFTGVPIVRDNCSEELPYTWSDVFYDFGCVGGQIGAGDGRRHAAAIVRTFTAVDASGNQSTGCRQVIYFDRPEVIQLPGNIRLDICRETIPPDEDGNPHPDRTGYPFFLNGFGDTIRLDAFRCQYSAVYKDQRFPGPCPGAYKVIRRWEVYDWCLNRVVVEAEQEIEAGDFQAPRLRCSTLRTGQAGTVDTLIFSTGPFNCTAAFLVPEPIVEGECSAMDLETAVYSYRRPTDPFGNPYGTPQFVKLDLTIRDGVASGVPVGTHYFVHTVRDDCGNEVVSSPCVFKVTDAIEPIAICAGDLTVSLGGSGIARLLASDIDKGSRDNCGPVELAVRRQLPAACLEDYVTSVYGVSFDALDRQEDTYYHEGAPVLHEEEGRYLSAWDSAAFVTCCDAAQEVAMDLRVQDAAGNVNICSIAISVEDKLAPLVEPPPAQQVGCEELAGLNLRDTTILQARFGRATAIDNCRAWTKELEAILALDDCGIGTITRRFQAFDEHGNRSKVRHQWIEITARHDYLLHFPGDADIRQCGQGGADSLDFETYACDFLAVNVEEEVFSGQGDACRRILRTYSVINWCEYDNESDPVVIGRREDAGAPAGAAVYVIRRPDGAFVDDNEDPADGYLREVTSTGYWQYTQLIDLRDDEAPVLEADLPDPFCSYGAEGNCDAPVELTFTIREDCSPESLQVSIFYDEGADNIRERNLTGTPAVEVEAGQYRVSGTFPIGSHQLIVETRDGCGNLAVWKLPFFVVDCQAPAPVCNGLVTAVLSPFDLDSNGVADTALATIQAIDLLASTPLEDCSGPLRFSVNRSGETPDPDRQQVVMGCSDLGAAVTLEVYAWDAADNPHALQPGGQVGGSNYDFCTVSVTVADPAFHCIGGTRIAGHVFSEGGIPIQGVSVQLTGPRAQTDGTDADGRYEFGPLAAGDDFSVRPVLDERHMNGVSTLDLVRISKHILGVSLLDSPYKMLAADVNRSGTITILDLIQLRKLILGVLPKLSQNTSWRFVQAAHQFTDPGRPFSEAVPEVLVVENLATPLDSANFIGLKVGDVTGDAKVDNLLAAIPRNEDRPLVHAGMKDAVLRTGEEQLVAITASELASTEGFQFTLEADPGRILLQEAMAGALPEEHMAFFAEQNSLTVSWDCYSNGRLNESDTLLILRVQATMSGALREAFRITSQVTPAEAYDNSETIFAVHLQIDTPDLLVRVGQNFPNPFVDQTAFELFLPREDDVLIQVYDVNGQLHWLSNRLLPAGRQLVQIPGWELPAGLLFYTVKTQGQTITKKMIRQP